MQTLEQTKRGVADLHWLATLLTGCRETASHVTFQALCSVNEASPFFCTWMDAWSRRILIAKALATVREDLAESAKRTALRRVEQTEFPPQSWTLDGETTKSDLERALLPIDVFPRAAILLVLFEGVPLNDATVLLDSKPELVRHALAIGARELTVNLARLQGSKPAVNGSGTSCEDHRVTSTERPS